MSVHVALLRGVNVGGRVMVAMADVRALFEELGFRGARTLLQSGNVVFSGAVKTDAELETRLEREALKRLGLRTQFVVRSVDEWADVIARNPFPTEAKREPSLLHVMFLKSPPDAAAVEALSAAVTGPEVIRAGARHIYITYPEGAGRSKLTGTVLEKKLGTGGTARNWNTVLKLHALATAQT